jgi:hypothetical protein
MGITVIGIQHKFGWGFDRNFLSRVHLASLLSPDGSGTAAFIGYKLERSTNRRPCRYPGVITGLIIGWSTAPDLSFEKTSRACISTIRHIALQESTSWTA